MARQGLTRRDRTIGGARQGIDQARQHRESPVGHGNSLAVKAEPCARIRDCLGGCRDCRSRSPAGRRMRSPRRSAPRASPGARRERLRGPLGVTMDPGLSVPHQREQPRHATTTHPRRTEMLASQLGPLLHIDHPSRRPLSSRTRRALTAPPTTPPTGHRGSVFTRRNSARRRALTCRGRFHNSADRVPVTHNALRPRNDDSKCS